MAIFRLTRLVAQSKSLQKTEQLVHRRPATTTATGAILSQPEKQPFGLIGIVMTIIPGLFVGAVISKSIANFLEENELFVPSDDDDDDD